MFCIVERSCLVWFCYQAASGDSRLQHSHLAIAGNCRSKAGNRSEMEGASLRHSTALRITQEERMSEQRWWWWRGWWQLPERSTTKPEASEFPLVPKQRSSFGSHTPDCKTENPGDSTRADIAAWNRKLDSALVILAGTKVGYS